MLSIRSVGPLALLLACPAAGGADDAAAAFRARVAPLLESRCARCHGGEKPKGKIDLAGPRDLARLAAERDLWFRVREAVESGTMPPEGERPLAGAERKAVADWVRGEFTGLLAAKQLEEGRARLRRLSRTEYANTVQDLFGVRPTVGKSLPDDGRVDGYDRVSAALPLSASGALGYYRMAEEVLRWTLRPKGSRPPAVRAAAMESGESAGHSLRLPDDTIVSFNSDTSSGRLAYAGAKVPGLHRLRLSVYGYQTDEPLPFGVYVGHTSAYPQVLDLVKVLEAPPGKAAVLEAEIYLRTRDLNDRSPVSDNVRLIPFGLGVQVPKNTQASRCRGPGLAVQWVEVEEPEPLIPGDRWLTADLPPALDDELRRSERANLSKDPRAPYRAKSVDRAQFLAAMAATFKRVGARLYRRDLTATELAGHVADAAAQADRGEPLRAAFLDRVAEMMTAPEFLCAIEPPGPLSDFALASRLSYFLWNSTPDEPLLQLARQGKLRDPKALKAQTERLLNDPKAARFADDFVDQWLGLRALDDTSPDGKLYPEYGELLKLSSAMETRAHFRRMLGENLSVRHLVASPWALVNGPLAAHYGLPEVRGVALRPVALPESSPYGGLWTQSAVLKVTANGTNTSPVKRGVWVAERLLGIPIPPPPPNVEPVEPDVRGAKTLRQQLALHSAGGSCGACHAKFDPYGFALEGFDVTGRYRTRYREVDADAAALPPQQRKGRPAWRDGLPVDASGRTPDGRTFSGVGELRRMLAERPEQLARGVSRHLLTYATGAPATAADGPALDAIVAAAAADDYGLRSLVHALVQSEPFRCK